MKNIRAGLGLDIHKLVKGRKLVLGGVHIPFGKGLDGWSDADCLTHSVIDALLGASGMGDIGSHFGSERPENKNISSLELLKKTVKIIKKYKVNNIDCTIICEKPKLLRYIPVMRNNLSKALKISLGKVNVKSTTAKKLGEIGKSRAIASYTIATIL